MKAVVINHGADVFMVEEEHDEELSKDGGINRGFDSPRRMHLAVACRPVARWMPHQTVEKFPLLGCSGGWMVDYVVERRREKWKISRRLGFWILDAGYAR